MARQPLQNATESQWTWLTAAALVIALGLVLVRMTITTQLHLPIVYPGDPAGPQTGGAGVQVALDLAGVLPAIMVLLRWALDRTFALRWQCSWIPLAALAVLGASSPAWAVDKFAAAVYAAHFVSAVCLMWAGLQLVRDWAALRLVAACCIGLLAILTIWTIYHLLVELPDLRAFYAEHKDAALRQNAPNPFLRRQFENYLNSNLVQGFWSSANTFGSIATLLMVITAGVMVQRWTARARRTGPAKTLTESDVCLLLLLVTFGGGIFIQFHTASRGAIAALLFALFMMALVGWQWEWFAQNARRAFFIGGAAVLLGIAAVIAHGLYHGGLPTSSLNFRWHYWVGAARMIRAHPWHGVGWDNFGQYYGQFRLPIASEDIKDPHNFILRIFCELGAIGGVLIVAWLGLCWWDMTRPRVPIGPDEEMNLLPRRRGVIAQLALVCLLILIGGCVYGIDWSLNGYYVGLEVLNRFLYALVFIILGMVTVVMSFRPGLEVGRRPASWILWATILAVAAFELHGLIDFAVLEPGPLALLALLIGSVLSLRSQHRPRRVGVAMPIIVCVIAGSAWLAAAIGFWTPIQAAEANVMEANRLLLAAPVGEGEKQSLDRRKLTQALADLTTAAEKVPYNADYPARAATVYQMLGLMQEADQSLQRAIALQPRQADLYHARIELALKSPQPDMKLITDAFERELALDPHNFRERLAYANFLFDHHLPGAAEQFQAALASDARLEPHDARHLTPEERQCAEQRLH